MRALDGTEAPSTLGRLRTTNTPIGRYGKDGTAEPIDPIERPKCGQLVPYIKREVLIGALSS